MTRRIVSIAAIFSLIAALSPALLAQTAAPPAPASPEIVKANAEMAAAAVKLWDSLSTEQKTKASYPLTDAERTNWHFTPGPWNGVARKGLTWADMTPMQREMGVALLKTALSQRGYEKAEATQKNEGLLGAIEGAGGRFRRDPQGYHFSIFGKPGVSEVWGWRFEGHHLAFNFTVAADKAFSGAPNFFGANPAKIPEGRPGAGTRILAAEEDLGRDLIKALDEEQRKVAIYDATAPRDIITGEQAKPAPLPPAGISASKMNADQKKILMALIGEYANRLRPELAKQDLQKIEQAGIDKIMFAWAGTIDVGGPHYYRVQGPTFLIEYDNTQNNANHIHAVWRDPANDFGEDILKLHYQQHPHPSN